MVAVEINEGSMMVAVVGAMASALVTLIFCYLAFRVSLESRLKDMEHQLDALADLEEAFLAQEEKIRDLEMETSRREAPPVGGVKRPTGRDRSIDDERIFPRCD
jgi:hypothetical protein